MLTFIARKGDYRQTSISRTGAGDDHEANKGDVTALSETLPGPQWCGQIPKAHIGCGSVGQRLRLATECLRHLHRCSIPELLMLEAIRRTCFLVTGTLMSYNSSCPYPTAPLTMHFWIKTSESTAMKVVVGGKGTRLHSYVGVSVKCSHGASAFARQFADAHPTTILCMAFQTWKLTEPQRYEPKGIRGIVWTKSHELSPKMKQA
ncbi:uncharacterized protein M421DRAFT_291106 [Didymella exigua CBS 183.55]|uniref:Uncharacterized protein n=1 Tax=Didymella exigua CBS 183.55 TaxID=1150837 RepID=A0A6A5RXT9_9PLEO|nr:uncharacterized protein M421DRAFT_291106 [Didymella exigua CBS 183.55]KAF1932403.1 hypothetical protein M421DRAFT_291106 [Didymella exigua CBS 183.55]